jgi:uroporphyrinogen decarboxylase
MTTADAARASRFLRACFRQPVDCTPVWIMRQAGRYLPEYRELRKRVTFDELCRTPSAACEATLMPVDRFEVDAAIIFSDILVPLAAMGIPVEFGDEGPRLEPIKDEAAIGRLHVPEPEAEMPFSMEAIRQTRRALAGRVPLIGFAGAPYTLLSYAVEGKTSRNHAEVKSLCFNRPEAAHRLLDLLTRTVTAYLNAQIRAGAQAVQLFDSWGGVLSRADFDTLALPYVQRIIAGLERGQGAERVPVIYFVGESAAVIDRMKQSGADVLGVDWRIDLAEARRQIGSDFAVQGNLDPCVLLGPPELVRERTAQVVQAAGDAPGHIFNLGHGILPPTPPDNARLVVDTVHQLTARQSA